MARGAVKGTPDSSVNYAHFMVLRLTFAHRIPYNLLAHAYFFE